ncbi:uncharacterized protein [Littorina saxatilis]|uniref:uncharacterized protein n=1 Tax=Littorina saxatilis TaxID=31220 RepID=UPI0038B4224C
MWQSHVDTGSGESLVLYVAHQGVGRCGNPTLTQVQRVLGDLKQHPHLELISVESILDTVRHLAVITTMLKHRCERGEFDQLIIAEMATVAKTSATQGKPVTATIVKSEDPVFIIDDENDDMHDSCHFHSQNVEATGKNFSRKSSSITRSQEQMELDGRKNFDDREFCADRKEGSWSLHSSGNLENADVHSKRQPGDWRFSDKDRHFQREGNDIDWKCHSKKSNEEPSYSNKSSHSVKLEEEGFTDSPPLLLPALAKPPQADVNTESRSVGQSGRRQAQQESRDPVGPKSPFSTAGGREKLRKQTGAESSLNSSLGQRKSVNESSCKTELRSHSADKRNLVSSPMGAKKWTSISPVINKSAEYSPGKNDLDFDSQEPQTWSCLSPYKGNNASKSPSDGELVFESKRSKRWTEGVPFTNCSVTNATGKSSTISSSISPGREDSARHFEHKDNSHTLKRPKTEGSKQHIDDDGEHTLVEKKTKSWLFEDGDSDSGGGLMIQTAKVGGEGSKLSGLTLFPRVSFDLHHKNGRDATSGNWSSPSKSGCLFSDLTPVEPASGDGLLGGHLDPLKKRRSSASGYTEGGSAGSCPASAAFLDAEWFDKTSSTSGGSSTSGATAKTTECSGLKREFAGSPVTKVSTRCKSPELRKKSRVTYKTEDMSPVCERVRGREAVMVALSNFHDRSDSEDSDSLPDIDLGVCPSRPPSFNAPPSLPSSGPREGWEREATPSHGGSNSQEGVIAGALSRAGNGGADDELGDKITQIAAVFPQMKGRQIAELLRHFGGDVERCVTAILEDPGLMGRQEMATSSNPTPPSTTTTSFIATASSSGGSINAFIDLTD